MVVSHLQAIGFYRKRRKSAFYRLLQEIESAYELAKIIVDVYISRIFGVYSDREVCKKLGAVKKGRVYRNCPSFVIVMYVISETYPDGSKLVWTSVYVMIRIQFYHDNEKDSIQV